LNAALRQLYFGDGQFYELSPDDDDFQFDFDDSLFDAAAREILDNGGYTPDYLTTPTGSALINETNRAFTDAISKGLGEQPDPAVAAALRENAFIFSGFKTHAELEQVAQLITDENGNIRPFNEFLNDVKQINQEYNHRYLRTEYNQAVQSAQMASKWADFERDKEHINLQYRTANDERVRASHRVLHGVTLPVDDEFWRHYFPPNGWGCRCTVVAVPKDDADYPVKDVHGSTIDGKEVFPTPAYEIFKTNTAKDRKVFPDKHPYLPKGCGNCKYKGSVGLAWQPNRIWCRACDAIRKCYQEREKENAPTLRKPTVAEKQAIYSKPISEQFTKDGDILIHELRDKNAMDYERVSNAAKLLASEGRVLVMPEIHRSESAVRQRFGLPDKSNPDLKVGNEWVDVKSPFSVEAISDNACAAQKQNAIACITDDMCVLKVDDLKDYARKVLYSQGYHKDKVYFIVDGELYKYNRQDLK
jgi:SPP1 gp7 family putative phage head morphogenesis protein